MGRLRLGLEVRDFDLDQVGLTLFVLHPGRNGRSGGYLRMSLDELSRFIAVLSSAEDIELSAIDAERLVPADREFADAGPQERPRTEKIALPVCSPGISEGCEDQEGLIGMIAEALPSADGGRLNIRISRGELRRPVLF